MSKQEELLNLRKKHSETVKKVNEFGEEQFKDTIELIDWLKELMEKIEKLKKQEESSNQDLRQKLRLGRKMQKAYKYDNSFESTIISAIDEGKLSKEIGERFKEMAKLLKKRKIEEMKTKFKYFENLLQLQSKYVKLNKEIKEEKSALQTKINKTKLLLKELDKLTNIDTEKIELLENYIFNLGELDRLRKNYINYLSNLRIKNLIDKIKENSLLDLGFPNINKNKINEIYILFNEDKFFSNMKISELCKYFDYSDQKLSHIYPEVSKFKKIILKERVWFDKISELEKTNFLTWKNDEKLNDKLIEFFRKMPEAKTILENMKKYEKELPKFKQYYKEYEEYKIKKEELSKYSKNQLEKELEEYEKLMQTLDSEKPIEEIEQKIEKKKKSKEEKEIKDQSSEGFLHKLKGFFG